MRLGLCSISHCLFPSQETGDQGLQDDERERGDVRGQSGRSEPPSQEKRGKKGQVSSEQGLGVRVGTQIHTSGCLGSGSRPGCQSKQT